MRKYNEPSPKLHANDTQDDEEEYDHMAHFPLHTRWAYPAGGWV